MSGSRRESNEKIKVKKMRKIELLQAIIKKKQCDAKALAIVEQLLEPNVDSDWLIQNLKFINKTHIEDVIEERVIIKLCGYVLCSKPLTVVVNQQYCISTRTNKVYDITKRKKFCSSWCYRASNYLLEQILESPLWLREKEIIPVFKLLPINSVESFHGDAVVGVNSSQNTNSGDIGENKELIRVYGTKQTKNHKSPTTSSIEVKNSSYSSSNTSVEEPTLVKDTLTNIETQSLCETHSSELCTNQQDEKYSFQICTNHGNGNNDHTEKENISSENLETHTAVQFNNIQHIHEHVGEEIEKENANVRLICSNTDIEILQTQLGETSNNTNDSSKISHSQPHKINNSPEDNKIVQIQLDRAYNKKNITSPNCDNIKSKSKKIKNEHKNKGQEESNDAKLQTSVYHNLVMHIEQSFREWVTKNTLCLLLNEEDEKFQLLENLTQQDKYEQLCKKLNRLQLQDKKEDHVDLEKNILKPVPHLSVLKEEGKKLELKVHAFYKGQMTIAENSNNELKNENDEEPILPLTSARTPNALRQQIFLDKLNKILPNLLYAITQVSVNASTSATQSICYNNTYSLIKLLVSTFHLSATNIVFKTAEWTLVGLIIIKMLSLIDTQLQSLLESKQASMYTSMILTSYKLDLSYLDRLMSDVINNKDTCK